MEAHVTASVAESVANGDYNQATGDLILQLLRDNIKSTKPSPPSVAAAAVAPPPAKATAEEKASHYCEAVKSGTMTIGAVKEAVNAAFVAGEYSRSHADTVRFILRIYELLLRSSSSIDISARVLGVTIL